MLCHAGRTNEAHRLHTRIFIQLLGIVVRTVNDVEHTVRQTGFGQQFGHTHRR
ncbi:hypothetical protein D3C71_2091410 [compost metagenome]